MKVTGISAQVKTANRVNIMIDGVYRFSLDIFQVGELGICIGKEYSESELYALETESMFGKLYARTLEYCMIRPHSSREVRDYLYRKTRDTRGKTGELKKGVPIELTERVYVRLVEKGYINDDAFARYWVENRNLRKGTSQRKLQAELRSKGVDANIIQKYLTESSRNDANELQKIIVKKRARYPDRQRFMQYLARQGFSYDDIIAALEVDVD